MKTRHATWCGHLVAQSDQTLEVDGYRYFPRESVRMDLLRPSPKTADDRQCRTACSSTTPPPARAARRLVLRRPGLAMKPVDHWFDLGGRRGRMTGTPRCRLTPAPRVVAKVHGARRRPGSSDSVSTTSTTQARALPDDVVGGDWKEVGRSPRRSGRRVPRPARRTVAQLLGREGHVEVESRRARPRSTRRARSDRRSDDVAPRRARLARSRRPSRSRPPSLERRSSGGSRSPSARGCSDRRSLRTPRWTRRSTTRAPPPRRRPQHGTRRTISWIHLASEARSAPRLLEDGRWTVTSRAAVPRVPSPFRPPITWRPLLSSTSSRPPASPRTRSHRPSP